MPARNTIAWSVALSIGLGVAAPLPAMAGALDGFVGGLAGGMIGAAIAGSAMRAREPRYRRVVRQRAVAPRSHAARRARSQFADDSRPGTTIRTSADPFAKPQAGGGTVPVSTQK